MPWPRQLSKGTANRPGLFVSVAAQFHADKSQKKIASVLSLMSMPDVFSRLLLPISEVARNFPKKMTESGHLESTRNHKKPSYQRVI